MFRRRRGATDPRRDAWAAYAGALDLHPLPGASREGWLDTLSLSEQPVGEVWTTRDPGTMTVFAYDVRPLTAGAAPERPPRPVIVVRDAKASERDVAFRAFARTHPLLAELEARRSGGFETPIGIDEFDERIGILARDGAAAEVLAGEEAASLRATLVDTIAAPGRIEALLVVGTGHVAWFAQRLVDPPFDELERVTVHLLTLAAWLRVATR